jgi:hypothetical protein
MAAQPLMQRGERLSAVTHKGKPQDSAQNKDNNNILSLPLPQRFFLPVQHEQIIIIIIGVGYRRAIKVHTVM